MMIALLAVLVLGCKAPDIQEEAVQEKLAGTEWTADEAYTMGRGVTIERFTLTSTGEGIYQGNLYSTTASNLLVLDITRNAEGYTLSYRDKTEGYAIAFNDGMDNLSLTLSQTGTTKMTFSLVK